MALFLVHSSVKLINFAFRNVIFVLRGLALHVPTQSGIDWGHVKHKCPLFVKSHVPGKRKHAVYQKHTHIHASLVTDNTGSDLHYTVNG